MWGVYAGLCLPWSRRAASVATRPTTWPSASIKCHCRTMVPAVGTNEPMKSLLALLSGPRSGGAPQEVSLFQKTANQEDTGDSGHCQGDATRRRERRLDDLADSAITDS